MSKIIIHQEKALKNDLAALAAVCPFNAIETGTAGLSINAGCKMCRLCTKRYPEIFEFQESQTPRIDKSQWQGIAVRDRGNEYTYPQLFADVEKKQ